MKDRRYKGVTEYVNKDSNSIPNETSVSYSRKLRSIILCQLYLGLLLGISGKMVIQNK